MMEIGKMVEIKDEELLCLLFVLTQKVTKKSRLHKIFLKSSGLQADDLNLSAEKADFEQQIVHAQAFQKSQAKPPDCLNFVAFLELLLKPRRFFNGKFYEANHQGVLTR